MEEQSSRTPVRWTIGAILNWTASYLADKGVSAPRLDAEILLSHCLKVDRLYLYLNLERPLGLDERAQFRALLRRRAAREPVALITGKKEFWSISFRIKPGVLIPRPETEILVEAVLQEIKDNPAPSLLEIGAGSGAVSVAVAKDNPRAEIIATDIEPTVLKTARSNAQDAGVDASVQFVAMDLFDAIRQGLGFDVIYSNPPYIPTDTIPTLEPEVRDFEPVRALDGGPDGLDVIQRLATQAIDFINRPGSLALEFGDGQEEDVRDIFTTSGFREIQIFRDLAGRARVIRGRI
jgi:release factor glutamine methyltransferase